LAEGGDEAKRASGRRKLAPVRPIVAAGLGGIQSSITPMKTFFFAMLLALCGCSRLVIHQTENDLAGNTQRRTDLSATSFFDAKSELAKARTTMTDKTQGIGVSGLNQESSSTGAVQVIKIVVEGAKIAAPIP